LFVAFGIFTISWFITRLVIFPWFPVSSVVFESHRFVDYSGRCTIWHVALVLLLALQVMDILWFLRIIRAVIAKLTTGKVGDNRSDTEEEDEEENETSLENGGSRSHLGLSLNLRDCSLKKKS
jgi:hypothetical protein